ncbi:MAG: c-type cytochrome [Geminicoccaceae bacterium]
MAFAAALMVMVDNERPAHAQAVVRGDPVAVIDLTNGEKLFKKCRQCHTIKAGETKIGPSLAGVVGRRPGAIEGFGYSQSMIEFGAAGTIWNTATLDAYLTQPRNLVQQTKMVFPGLRRAADRADLIAYLSQFR